MKNRQKNEKISSLAALLLFAVFAVCIMMVLLTGAKVYQRLVRRDQVNYDRRTAVSYLAARIRHADCLEGIRTEHDDGMDVLVITEMIEGVLYETRIYCHNGYICELFTFAESTSLPEDGVQVMPAASLEADVQDGYIQIKITDEEGYQQTFAQYLRSGKELSE